jgi:hypothetical protein
MTAPEGKLEADSAVDPLTSLRVSGARAKSEEDCGDFGIRIDRNGIWYYQGSPIGRKPMVKLFATVLNRHDDGTYWLTTPVENGHIEVEDVPYVAVEMIRSGEGPDQKIDFRTNLDARVPLDQDHPLRIEIDPETGEPAPYIHVEKGLEARLARSVFYHLVEIGENNRDSHRSVFGVWSRGRFYVIGDAESP